MINPNNEAHLMTSPLGVDLPRTTFDRSFGVKGSGLAGKLNVMLVDEILPGDTVDLQQTMLTRMTTPYFPVMDDAIIDRYIFFVPNRLVWEHSKEFFGENNSSAWTQTTTYTIPTLDVKGPLAGGYVRSVNDLPHQFGIPLAIDSGCKDVNALPLRAYRLIWNEWFRDQNLQAPKLINLGDTESDGSYYQLEEACKLHDYFTSCLPAPQKGNAVTISLSGLLPVVTGSQYPVGSATNPAVATHMVTRQGYGLTGVSAVGQSSGNPVTLTGTSGTAAQDLVFDNLWAKADIGTLGITVNELRLAVQTQKILEKLAIGGSRYVEFVKSMFGVTSPDGRQQRPELLATARTHLNMSEVTQSSPVIASENTTPLGTVGAYSKTVDADLTMSHSFTEHGYLIGVFVMRHNRTYSQGLAPMWTRKTMLDIYLPSLAHIGEQPVYNREIYAVGSNPNSVFGYKEPWVEYKIGRSIATGLMDPSVTGTLGTSWTYGDLYASQPILSSSWIKEGHDEVARTLAVTNEDQFIYDCWTSYKHTRCMPAFGVPGFVDHF